MQVCTYLQKYNFWTTWKNFVEIIKMVKINWSLISNNISPKLLTYTCIIWSVIIIKIMITLIFPQGFLYKSILPVTMGSYFCFSRANEIEWWIRARATPRLALQIHDTCNECTRLILKLTGTRYRELPLRT